MIVGISDCFREDKFEKYVDWIRIVDPTIEFERLSYKLGPAPDVSNLDGLLLTGGGDVDPLLYASPDTGDGVRGVDRPRDEFEIEIIKKTLDADLPILGVCRGMQMMNVALGGSLHVDLQSNGFNDHSGSEDRRIMHALSIEPNSLLSDLAGGIQAEVNSYHHQAIDELGAGLKVVAQSPDGVIEAAEWTAKEGSPFLMLVQWHPERFAHHENSLSINLARMFLREMQYTIANKST